AAGHDSSITAPIHPQHPIGMPTHCLAEPPTRHVPQFHGSIPAHTDKCAAIRGERQAVEPDRMRLNGLDADGRTSGWQFPESNDTCDVATREHATIATPGNRDDRSRMRQFLKQGTDLRIPKPNCGIVPATGDQAPIGSKYDAIDTTRVVAHPA